MRDLLLRIPNLPVDLTPDGDGPDDNVVLRVDAPDPSSYAEHQRVPHWEVGAALGILDLERATKISGSMFTMLRGLGATLSRALCQLALDRNADAFEEVRPPSLVTTATLTATGQLPKFADDAYHLERDDLWAIPTAEVPLTSMARDEILDEADLPVRLMAYTPCFRREAGSAGRDTRGLLRMHEFDKVEIFAYRHAGAGARAARRVRGPRRGTVAALGLAYRVLEICTGDLGQSHHRSIDIEVYAPGTAMWLEVSSVSWFSDYQARRANIRYRPSRGQGHRDRPHAERLGARGAASVGGRRRDPPPSRRLGRRSRGAVALHAGRTRHTRQLMREARAMGIADLRTEYEAAGLDVADVLPNPVEQWLRWYEDAVAAGAYEPNAMVLSTVDADGHADARFVLVRGVDERGFTFYTNLKSAKSQQLAQAPQAALTFGWLELHRQVRVRGHVIAGTPEEADAYFASRPRGAQVGAWASPQSDEIHDREWLDERVAAIEAALRRHRRAPTTALGWLAARADHVGVLAGTAEPRCTIGCSTRGSPRVHGGSQASALELSQPPRPSASTSASVWGLRPGPSQSAHSGVVPRTRGGSSSWTPPSRGRFTGLSGWRPRRSRGIASMSVTTS